MNPFFSGDLRGAETKARVHLGLSRRTAEAWVEVEVAGIQVNLLHALLCNIS
jgi:hypothetical protein